MIVAPAATLRAAIYVRVSSPGQEKDGASLETQEAACRAYCDEHGYQVDALYREVYTGADLWERPRLAILRDTIRRGEIDVLVVHAIDRLSRDPVHLGVLISEADHHRVNVVFVTEPLDDSPEGELIRFVKGYAARVEREKFRERSMRGIKHRIATGKPLPGVRVLYGYRWNKTRTKYVIDPVAGKVVRRIYRECLEGRTLRAIATGLTADRIPTPKGGSTWVYTVVSKILQNPRYTGHAVALRYATTKGEGSTAGGRQRRLVRERPAEQQIQLPKGVIPPLVSADVFAAVADRLGLNKARSARNTRDPEAYLLRGGYVRCGYCDRVMSGVRQSSGQYIYRCAGASASRCYQGITARLLDDAVWSKVERTLTEPETVAAELERAIGDDPAEPDLSALDRKLSDVERKQQNLARRVADEDDDEIAAVLSAEIKSLAEQKRRLAEERDTVLTAHAAQLAARAQTYQIVAWCRSVAAKLGDFDYAKRRLALESLGVKVTVWRADHEPRYHIEAGIPLEGDFLYPTRGRSVQKITLRWTDRDAS